MTIPLDKTLNSLNDCECCTGLAVQTPVKIYNRPGLEAIAYRIGIHAQFKQTLLAYLSDAQFAAIKHLNTRENDDFTIALLDAWATVLDVLTFYNERYIQESYLLTATERLSLRHLGQMIGYKPGSGVAASTYLAFTLEDAPGSPQQVPIEIGTKVQSIPEQNEKAQIFETIEKIEARVEWNGIKPRLTQRNPIEVNRLEYYLAGITTQLQSGSGLLLLPNNSDTPIFRKVAQVIPQLNQNRTFIRLQQPTSKFIIATADLKTLLAVSTPPPRSPIVSTLVNQSIPSADLSLFAQFQLSSTKNILANVEATKSLPPKLLTFRTEAAIFGHNAPSWEALPSNQKYGEFIHKSDSIDSSKPDGDYEEGIFRDRQNEWVDNDLANYPNESSNNLFLDRVYPQIVKNSWIVLKDNNQVAAYQVEAVTELTKSDFGLTNKITRLTLVNPEGLENFKIRSTKVFAQSEELELSPLPINTPISGAEIELNKNIDGLFIGQNLMICGEDNQDRGTQVCEKVTIAQVTQVLNETGGFTRLTLSTKLKHDYVRESVTIHGNVALATHGETVQEVLGTGDASQTFPRFALRQANRELPLTYISADTPSGAESTLQVRVNGLLWHEVPNFLQQTENARVFTTKTDDEGKTKVQFGDDKMGESPLTGQEITATYRKGIGIQGNVKAGQLSQLMTRQMGVRGVNNPLPATGGDNPESRDSIRRNAPLTMLTLDRIVSLQDFEDFAQAFNGIAKALATWTWDGQKKGVFITIAAPHGEDIPEDSVLYQNLLSAIRKASDCHVPLRVKSYQNISFRLAAKVTIDSDYQAEKVLSEVRQALKTHFSFEQRRFGQGVTLSEVMAVIQSQVGVIAVDVDRLYLADSKYFESAALSRKIKFKRSPGLFAQPLGEIGFSFFKPQLRANIPQAGSNSNQIKPAELITLDESSLSNVRATL